MRTIIIVCIRFYNEAYIVLCMFYVYGLSLYDIYIRSFFISLILAGIGGVFVQSSLKNGSLVKNVGTLLVVLFKYLKIHFFS